MKEFSALKKFVDLAQPRLGAEVLSTSDDFFAEKENLINPSSPKFIEGKFTDRGKWMDGWESRRRRGPGHDHCVIKICRGVIKGVNIDTKFFTGNFPEIAMLEACDTLAEPDASAKWEVLVEKTRLNGDADNVFHIDSDKVWNHLRLNIYPDGGVARLRVFGEVFKDWNSIREQDVVDLIALQNGGVTLSCSDMHFGDMSNILSPGRGVNMGDGWETRRRRGEGKDWVIVQLGHPGQVKSIEIDTSYFIGNYPAMCAVQGVMAPGASLDYFEQENINWSTLLSKTKTYADRIHRFDLEAADAGTVSHLKLEIYPDGGVSRFRAFGNIQSEYSNYLKPEPLTADAFVPFGDVIEIEDRPARTINYGYAQRYENLAELDLVDEGIPALSIFKAKPVAFPFAITRMERHPRASQAFIPKTEAKFLVVVAPATPKLNQNDLRLFVTNGRQGVNFHRGVWHHFLLTIGSEQEFIVIDRSNPDENTEEVELYKPCPIITQIK